MVTVRARPVDLNLACVFPSPAMAPKIPRSPSVTSDTPLLQLHERAVRIPVTACIWTSISWLFVQVQYGPCDDRLVMEVGMNFRASIFKGLRCRDFEGKG